MTTASDIGWGTYDKYEGPFFRGHLKYSPPAQADFSDKVLSVITATEGGAYDAINMYDRCILSVGIIQWCEAGQFSVTSILGRCAESDKFMMDQKMSSFPIAAEFKKNPLGVWRFYKGSMEVATQDLQRLLYLGSPSVGQKGTWTPETKQYAKTVAAWFANFWDYPLFCTIQGAFTKAKLVGFLMPDAKRILFQGTSTDVQFSWSGALRAAYYSFAANLPTVASKSLVAATQDPAWATASAQDQFFLALKALTFGPGIGIYPVRYEAIAPVLAHLFDVPVPMKASELKSWTDVPHPIIELTDAEKAQASRLVQLSDAVRMGMGDDLDAVAAALRSGNS